MTKAATQLMMILLSLSFLWVPSASGIDIGRMVSAAKNVSKVDMLSDEQKASEVGRRAAIALTQQAPLVDNPAIQVYVNAVGLWLARHSSAPDLHWRFGVLENGSANAFAAPDGYIFVTSALLRLMRSEAELAGLLAHEICHVEENHHLRTIQSSARTGLLADVVSIGYEVADKDSDGSLDFSAESLAVNTSMLELYERGLSKSDENKADIRALELAAKAGYDPAAYAVLLQRIDAVTKYSPITLSFLSVHRKPKNRLKDLEKPLDRLEQDGRNYQTLSDRYIAAVD